MVRYLLYHKVIYVFLFIKYDLILTARLFNSPGKQILESCHVSLGSKVGEQHHSVNEIVKIKSHTGSWMELHGFKQEKTLRVICVLFFTTLNNLDTRNV